MNRVYKKENALKYMKVCPTSLTLEAMQVKITMKQHFFPVRLVKSKNWIILYVGGHVETGTVLGKYTVEDSIALIINIFFLLWNLETNFI